MSIKKRNSSKNSKKATFTFTKIDLSIVNSIRRIIIAEIPNVAIDFNVTDVNNQDFNIVANSCALHNEFLAHRISLLPICLSSDEIENFDRQQYKFILKVKNTTAETITVTSKDIKIYDAEEKLYSTEVHQRIFPKHYITGSYIILTKLKPNYYNLENGEEVNIEFFASKNTALTHARWSPVSQCSFINVIDTVAADQAFSIRSEGFEGEELDKLKKQFDTLEAFRHFKKNKYDEPSEFEMTIETECALTPEYLLQKSIDVLIDKIENFKTQLETITINKMLGSPNFYELEIKGETYTLVNVLQAMIYNLNMRGDNASSTDLEFIGYYNPHPLDNKMVLKVKLKSKIDVKEFLKTYCDEIQKLLASYTIK